MGGNDTREYGNPHSRLTIRSALQFLLIWAQVTLINLAIQARINEANFADHLQYP